MSALRELSESLARVCLAEEVSGDDLARLGDDPARWRLYRAMVRQRLRDAAAEALPRTLGAVGDARFDAWLARYLDRAPPRTRYVRGVAAELAVFVLSGAGDDALVDPPWLRETLSFEAHVHAIAYAPPAEPTRVDELSMDAPAVFAPNHARLRVSHAVHRASPGTRPDARDCALWIYRDDVRHTVETLELSPLAADVLDALRDTGCTLTDAVTASLARHGGAASAAFIAGFADFLADLTERGVLLGSRAVIA